MRAAHYVPDLKEHAYKGWSICFYEDSKIFEGYHFRHQCSKIGHALERSIVLPTCSVCGSELPNQTRSYLVALKNLLQMSYQ